MITKLYRVKVIESVEVEREFYVNAVDTVDAEEKAILGEVFADGISTSKVLKRKFIEFLKSGTDEF